MTSASREANLETALRLLVDRDADLNDAALFVPRAQVDEAELVTIETKRVVAIAHAKAILSMGSVIMLPKKKKHLKAKIREDRSVLLLGDAAYPTKVSLPKRRSARENQAHRRWVRSHCCCVPGCKSMMIQFCHVRLGIDDPALRGGTGLLPDDQMGISLCRDHHMEQHRIGEASFARKYRIDMVDLAKGFAARSPAYRDQPARRIA